MNIYIIAIALLFAFIYFVPLSLYVTLKLTGVHFPLWKLTLLKYQKINVGRIANTLIVVHKAQMNIPEGKIIELVKNGSDIENIIKGMLMAAKKGESLTLEEAKLLDSQGIDLLKKFQ